MPVPQPKEETAPRRLLRDVVFIKMLDAILDGTLEPGERLNDDELVKWLAVSRTPIREAISRLNAWGLVELEANRYTRVATVTQDAYLEASALLDGLHDLAVTWTGGKLPASGKKQLAASRKKIAAQDPEGARELLDVFGSLVYETGNALFVETELPLRTRVKFLSPHTANGYAWDALAERARSISA